MLTQIPFYGRERELRQLNTAAAVARQGTPQLIWVSGSSGVGKTALIRQAIEQNSDHHFLVLTGKFEQYGQYRPYSGWLHALDELANFVHAQPAEQRDRWQETVRNELGQHAALLAEMAPALGTLLAQQHKSASAAHDIPPAEIKHQIKAAFLRLLRLFKKQGQTCVMVLDDAQWMDTASLELLEWLPTQLDNVPLLFIVTYRDSALSESHPLTLTLQQLEQQSRMITHTIEVAPFSRDDVALILADLLARPFAECHELCETLMAQCHGNPLFLFQLLRMLQEQNWLYTDANGHWHWHIDSIRAADVNGSIAELMHQRFQSLASATQNLLSQAACIGVEFDAALLAAINDRAVTEISGQLEDAIVEGFIHRTEATGNDTFRFCHDRMQEAAHQALDTESSQQIHAALACHLQAKLSAAERAERVIEITHHLQLAQPLLDSSAAVRQLMELSLVAARKAKLSAAFKSALDILRGGMLELPDNLWATDPEFAYELYLERGELEYLNREFAQAEHFIDLAIENEPDTFKRINLYAKRIVQCTLQARYHEAISVARYALAELHEGLPKDRFRQERDHEIERFERLLGQRSLAELGDLPEMSDRHHRAHLRLLITLGPACYRAHPSLWSLLVARQARLCIEHGVIAAAGYTFPALGGLLIHLNKGTGQHAEQLYQATQTLSVRLGNPAERSMSELMMGSSLSHWFQPARRASDNYLEAYRIGQQSANLQYAVYGFGHDTYARFFQGESISELIPRVRFYLDYAEQRGNLWGIDLMTGALRLFAQLAGAQEQKQIPQRVRELSEADYLDACERHQNLQVLCLYHVMRMFVGLLKNDRAQALESLEQAESRLDSISVQGLLPSSQFHVAKLLIQGVQGAVAREQLISALESYRNWEADAPENFRHWRQLLQAELAHLDGQFEQAIELYDLAFKAAGKQENWLAAAVITKHIEDFWQQKNHHAFATLYRQQHLYSCERFNCEQVIEARRQQRTAPAQRSQVLSTESVIHIVQSLASFTELEHLLPVVLDVVVEHTGSERLAILLERDGELQLAIRRDGDDVCCFPEPNHEEPRQQLPLQAIQYVARTQKPLHFNQRNIHEFNFSAGRGWRDLAQGVALALPLVYLGETVGVLYLENRSESFTFDERQMPIIELIAAQTATCIRTIDLMQRLENEGKARQEAELRMKVADAEVASQKKLRDEMQKLANTDPLTELPNRRLFIARLEEVWQQTVQAGQATAAVLMLDIDYFKTINDQFGHSAGDAVLMKLAEHFHEVLRRDDLAARIGGEEFGIIIDGSDYQQAEEIAERLCKRIAEHSVEHKNQRIRFTVSIGVAQVLPTDTDYEAILHRADQSLYAAKDSGRNQIYVHSS
ncbi:diguanylate cyclase domain-containing protein [Pseudidiomarina insulisalsae]|uniref:GGDEF domain-containing protein n=1 Tax=Pseudidiomarina insulisalsae TaxID=575789 RepID=A0A432YQS5_9GAMM|nr:diguanylate cyclase [Pseudidiomarina insulisalsae]RUO63626.1 hypothetical protein CWI71_00745 [Pseudidiomarina insulisalsae]